MTNFTITGIICGQPFLFQTSPEVFSYHHLDKGSRFLLETLIPQFQSIPQFPYKILDLGCGYGAIGLVLAKLNPKSKVFLVDENKEAIRLAMANAKQNSVENVEILRIDATRGLKLGTKFDLVISNPPTHQGKQVIRDIIETAFQNLNGNGRLVMVFNRLYSTSYVMEEIFGNARKIATMGGYKLVEGLKIPGRSNQLHEDIKKLLTQNKIAPDPLKDQYFLADEDVIQKIVAAAAIKPNDTILEIGPGLGQITSQLARKAGKVLAIEIDYRFKPILDRLPKNVEMTYGHAWKILGSPEAKNLRFNKMVANIPYSLCEPLMHKFSNSKKCPSCRKAELIILAIPEKFLAKIVNHHIFSAFYKIENLFAVSRASFYPMPKVNSAVIKLTHLPQALTKDDVSLWVRRFLYNHESAKTKNTLRLAIEKLSYQLLNKKLTKNEARHLLDLLPIDKNLLVKPADNSEIYWQSATALENFFLTGNQSSVPLQ